MIPHPVRSAACGFPGTSRYCNLAGAGSMEFYFSRTVSKIDNELCKLCLLDWSEQLISKFLKGQSQLSISLELR